MKKLSCHCESVELEIKESENALNKFLRCNCSLCKKKGIIMTFAPIVDVKIIKGKKKLKLYQYHTKVAELCLGYVGDKNICINTNHNILCLKGGVDAPKIFNRFKQVDSMERQLSYIAKEEVYDAICLSLIHI